MAGGGSSWLDAFLITVQSLTLHTYIYLQPDYKVNSKAGLTPTLCLTPSLRSQSNLTGHSKENTLSLF